MNEYIHAGNQLRSYLIIKGKSQADLARALDTSPPQIIRYMKSSNMKLHTAQKICSFLDVSLQDFLGLDDA